MTAEILIPVAAGAVLLAFVLSMLLRRRPKRSARLVSASLESAPNASADDDPSERQIANQEPETAVSLAKVSKPAAVVAPETTKKAKPAPAEEEDFLPTLAPTPVAATSARASVPSQSSAPKFVLQAPLKSVAPSRKTKAVATAPVSPPKPEQHPAVDLAPASDKVVDITTAISVRAPQKTKISRSALPEEIRAGLAKLNQRIDRLEDAVLDLENQLEDFDLDFSQSAKTQKTVSNAPAESGSAAAPKTDVVTSDRDEKTIAA